MINNSIVGLPKYSTTRLFKIFLFLWTTRGVSDNYTILVRDHSRWITCSEWLSHDARNSSFNDVSLSRVVPILRVQCPTILHLLTRKHFYLYHLIIYNRPLITDWFIFINKSISLCVVHCCKVDCCELFISLYCASVHVLMIGVEFFFEFNVIYRLELWTFLQAIRPATPTLGVKDFKLYIFQSPKSFFKT